MEFEHLGQHILKEQLMQLKVVLLVVGQSIQHH